MTTHRSTALAGVAGIAFAVLSVSRVLYSGEINLPTWEDSPAKIADYYHGLPLDGVSAVAMLSVLVGYSLFLVFIAKAISVLLPEHDDHRWAAGWIFAFAAMDVGLIFFYVGLGGGARQMSAIGITNPDIYAAFHAARYGLYWVDLVLQPFWLAPLGYLIVVTRRFPRWLGVVMLATAAVQPAAFFLPAPIWDITGFTYLWVLVGGIVMVVRRERYAPEPSKLTTN